MAETKTYDINIRWVGERRSMIRKENMKFLSGYPPRFGKGDPAWTPEELYLAALDLSLMSYFLDECLSVDLRPLTWESLGFAEVTYERGKGRTIKALRLTPKITVPRWEDEEKAEMAMGRVQEIFHLKPPSEVPFEVVPNIIPGPKQGRGLYEGD